MQLDHFGMFSHNLYKSAFELSGETGLGHYDGGFFPNYGQGTKIFPLGPDLFLELEGMVDYGTIRHIILNEGSAAAETPVMTFMRKMLAKPEVFFLWSFRTESLEEMNELARATGWTVDHDTLNADNAQQMMNGDKIVVVSTPRAAEMIPNLGMPNVYFWPDMNKHDARYPVIPETKKKTPTGLAWIEVGGTEKQFDDWFCGFTKAQDHPLVFNGKAPGLYTIAVNTDAGEVLIQRPGCNE